jgi:hypothetical protein
MKDFTLDAYENLLKIISNKQIPTFTILDHYNNRPVSGITIRHDVDRKAHNSLLVARLENKYGIKSTYYFRMTKESFQPNIIKEIANLGHEIGYHYEDLSTARGDIKKAFTLFEANLKKLREISKIESIAMHGSPLLPWDNRDLWKHKYFTDFALKCEALVSIDYTRSYYITDTGRSWSGSSVNIRDHVESLATPKIASTTDLISLILKNPEIRLALVMHPERWTNSKIEWTTQLFKDTFINLAKRVAKTLWKLKIKRIS